jgi:hypothetical protein
LRNSFFTCSGNASVATSKSFGWMPSSRSRTQPPTRNAWKPPSRSRYSTRNAFGEMPDRETECSERLMIRGAVGGAAVGASVEFNAIFLGLELSEGA